MTGALFPGEIDTTLLELGEQKVHNERGDWSSVLTYDGEPLHLQTPWMRNVFGVSEYKNSNVKSNFSVSFELDENIPDVKEFKAFLTKLDDWFRDQFKRLGIKGDYYSSVRPSKREHLPDTIRLKLKTMREQFTCQYMENSIGRPFGTADRNRVCHGDHCRSIIELMPVWNASGRTGVTWKVVTLMKRVSPEFRKPQVPDGPAPMKRQLAIPGGFLCTETDYEPMESAELP